MKADNTLANSIPNRLTAGSALSVSPGKYNYRSVLKNICKPGIYEKIDQHWIDNLGVMEK